jgi:hypothetical protein
VQAHGPGAKRNFPGENISEPPVTVGVARKSSRYIGVYWMNTSSTWHAKLADPLTKRQRQVGSYSCEEDAARAYDRAAVQSRGPGAKRNFPGEAMGELRGAISELPVAAGGERQRGSSRDNFVLALHWHEANSSWRAELYDPQTKRGKYIGYFASEEDAARAYDFAAVQAHGPGANRNFPGEAAGELPS